MNVMGYYWRDGYAPDVGTEGYIVDGLKFRALSEVG